MSTQDFNRFKTQILHLFAHFKKADMGRSAKFRSTPLPAFIKEAGSFRQLFLPIIILRSPLLVILKMYS